MALKSKICGINSPAALAAAAAGGADFVGFVFYPPSPRAVTPAQAATLSAQAPAGLGRVGLFVDADDRTIADTLETAPLDLLQLHGDESPERLAEIRRLVGLPLIKALKIADPADLDAVARHAAVADWLLFDAKAPKSTNPEPLLPVLPGGNALSFDWRLLADCQVGRPWFLSGGLDAGNLAQAVALSGARAVDVSSGVESRRGLKSPTRIEAFLARAAEL
jgi:phosphoribosylanthranilate isomerase